MLPQLISPSQAGFITGRSAVANIRKVLTALEHAKRFPEMDSVIVALDAKRAFDNVSLTWLAMKRMGFEGLKSIGFGRCIPTPRPES